MRPSILKQIGYLVGPALVALATATFGANLFFGYVQNIFEKDQWALHLLFTAIVVLLVLTYAIAWYVIANRLLGFDYIENDTGKHLAGLTEETKKILGLKTTFDGQLKSLAEANNVFTGQVAKLSEESEKVTKNTQDMAEKISASVKGALKALNATNLMSKPEEYGQIFSEYIGRDNPPNDLTFVGTMAGYNFTIGHALSQFILSRNNEFSHVNIFTPCKKNDKSGLRDDTIIYCLYFVLNTFIDILSEVDGKRKEFSLEVRIGYMKRDIFSAAIMIPNGECVVMPAMVNEALQSIVEDEDSVLLGIRYKMNDSVGSAIYDRYKEVIDGYVDRYISHTQDYDEIKSEEGVYERVPEIWSLDVTEDGRASLEVKAPRWKPSGGRKTIETKHAFEDVDRTKTYIFSHDGAYQDLLNELEAFVKMILNTPAGGGALRTLRDRSRLRYGFA